MSLPVEAGRSELDRSFGFVSRSNCRDRRRRMLMNTNDHEDIGNVIAGRVPWTALSAEQRERQRALCRQLSFT